MKQASQLYTFFTQVKLQTNREQMLLVRKQLENCEGNSAVMERRLKEVLTELDTCRVQCSQASQEKQLVQKALENVKMEKYALEKHRVEMGSMVSGLTC